MNEITKGVSYKEYLLTLIRILVFLNYLGKDHKKNTSEDRIVLYDFFLKYPELTNSSEKMDFDTKYSYFHWKPNYKLYATLLVELQGRLFISYDKNNSRYYIDDLGLKFLSNMSNSYIDNLGVTSEYLSKNICKLSNKAITEHINHILLKNRE